MRSTVLVTGILETRSQSTFSGHPKCCFQSLPFVLETVFLLVDFPITMKLCRNYFKAHWWKKNPVRTTNKSWFWLHVRGQKIIDNSRLVLSTPSCNYSLNNQPSVISFPMFKSDQLYHLYDKNQQKKVFWPYLIIVKWKIIVKAMSICMYVKDKKNHDCRQTTDQAKKPN